MFHPLNEVTIAVVGKYIKYQDAYKSVYESLDHAGIAHQSRVIVRRVESEDIEREGAERVLGGVDGVLVPGGFGYRGIAGKVEAIRFARERGVPFFGICLGLQCAVIEFARNVVRPRGRQHHRDRPQLPPPGRLPARRPVQHHPDGRDDAPGAVPDRARGGQPGAGRPTAARRSTSATATATSSTTSTASSSRRTACRFSGTSPDGKLVEVVEMPDHPWFLAVQCHPEFRSKPTQSHPLFRGFLQASLRQREGAEEDAVEGVAPDARRLHRGLRPATS